MTPRNDMAALVLAAGYSSRMKEFKPLLPIGTTTALERAVSLFRNAEIHNVRVVVGYRAQDLTPLLDNLSVRRIVNDRFHEGMFSSVKAGVIDLEPSVKAFFMLPVDIPLVRESTVLDILAAHDKRAADVWYPRFRGKRGHPPLISTKLSPSVLAWTGGCGLRGVLQQHETLVVDVDVADEHVLMGMNEPDEYRSLVAALADYDIPSASECMVLLTEKFRVDEHIVVHAKKVSEVALRLTHELNKTGCNLNVKLIVAAALLHDLAKGKRDHPAVAAEILTGLGYSRVADVVARHMDTGALQRDQISHEEVVCLADKMVQGDMIVSVEERFGNRVKTYGDLPAMVERVLQRRSNILAIRERIGKTLGSPVESLFQRGSLVGREPRDEGLSFEAW